MEKSYWKNIAPLVLLGVLIVLSFIIIRPILLSIFTGILLAFIFSPLYKKIIKKYNRPNAVALSLCVLFIILIFIPLWFLVPILLGQSIEIFSASQQVDIITPLQNTFPALFQIEGFQGEISSIVYSFITRITTSIMNIFSTLLLNFFTIFLQTLVVMFTFFFALRDNDKLIAYVQSILPFSKDVEKRLFKSSRDLTLSVLYGQVILGVIQGLVVGISFFLFGVNNALFLTIVACLAGIFPIIGTSVVWLPVMAVLFIRAEPLSALGILLFGITSTIFLENVVKPSFVSKRSNLHSALILLGMIGGILFFGILGVILGPLILSYLIIILEIYRDKRVPGPIHEGEK